MSDCYNCKYAYITKGPTLIQTKRGDSFIQANGGATCVASLMQAGIKIDITMTDKGMECSAYAPGNGISLKEYKVLQQIEEKT